jgi:hypothetical protein
MKKIITAFAIIFCVAFFAQESKAQGNLQFNQIIFYDIVFNGTQNFTVPAGKVWKIESVGTGSTSSTPLYLRNAGGVAIAHFNSSGYSSASFPYWLPPGFAGTFANIHPSIRATVSIIEFNVVP